FDRADAKDSFIATAKRAGESGHYVGEVKFPSAGQWNWKVDIEQSGMVTQDMPPLSVLDAVPGAAPPTAAPSAAVPAPNSTAMPLAAGIVGLIGAIGGVIGYLRTRRRFALALAAVAVLIGALGFVSASSSVARPVEPQPVAARDQTAVARDGAAATRDQAALGRDLFMAKGCVMCHLHPDVQTKDGPYWIGAEPPALNNGKYTAEYLRVWLKDPAALKPQTEMPKLGLSDAEIEALIAFLTGK
ncbi:MAG TPA: cytochrome c, partial [Anaerolineae bacterium]|nr:cytochrome c [Anaerolineae bacterium]